MSGLLPAMMADLPASAGSDDARRSEHSLREHLLSDVIGHSRDRATEALDGWLALAQVALGEALVAWFGDSVARDKQRLLLSLDRDIAAIDVLVTGQVNAILHAKPFQGLEARWRGLQYITDAASESTQARVRVLPVSWTEVVRDLERAADFDQSQLYQKIYTQEFGTLGGEPIGLLVGDYEVQHRPGPDHPTDDVAALKALALIAAASFAPIILGVSPRLFQLESFHELGRPIDLRAVFRQVDYQRWQAMREGAEMRFVGLVMPRVLLRLPYRQVTARNDGFQFNEPVHAVRGDDHLWGNGSFAFASVTLRAFANFGWFADIRGAPRDELRGGGLVTDLPFVSFATDRAGVAPKPSTECVLSDAQEKDLADLGFIALRRVPYTTYSVFYANQSIQMPPRFDVPLATINARLSSMLQYMLCVSRFAHYVKVLGRNYIGTMMTADECQQALQDWLMDYCEGSDDASLDTKARYPLREATVEIRDVPGKPGAYSCKLFLRPHYQLDDIASGFRLITELAPAANVA